MRPFAGWARGDSGSSAVEFAILAPIFLLMLTGMLAYGIYFAAAHALQQLAADAARTAIAGLDETERDALVQAFLDANTDGYGLLERRLLHARIGDKPGDPDHYRVTLIYDASELPIWNLYPPLPLPSRQIAHSSTIRRGGI